MRIVILCKRSGSQGGNAGSQGDPMTESKGSSQGGSEQLTHPVEQTYVHG